jgi:hypothetical protein
VSISTLTLNFLLLFSPYIGHCLHFGEMSYMLFIVFNASYRHIKLKNFNLNIWLKLMLILKDISYLQY